jgi:hypothetical protein
MTCSPIKIQRPGSISIRVIFRRQWSAALAAAPDVFIVDQLAFRTSDDTHSTLPFNNPELESDAAEAKFLIATLQNLLKTRPPGY